MHITSSWSQWTSIEQDNISYWKICYYLITQQQQTIHVQLCRTVMNRNMHAWAESATVSGVPGYLWVLCKISWPLQHQCPSWVWVWGCSTQTDMCVWVFVSVFVCVCVCVCVCVHACIIVYECTYSMLMYIVYVSTDSPHQGRVFYWQGRPHMLFQLQTKYLL